MDRPTSPYLGKDVFGPLSKEACTRSLLGADRPRSPNVCRFGSAPSRERVAVPPNGDSSERPSDSTRSRYEEPINGREGEMETLTEMKCVACRRDAPTV